ncbi:exported hypothetical protein [Verrucomicrobia bacterium]|nr:exported hypothetical protein [Verrucomicrobiota bacterium]
MRLTANRWLAFGLLALGPQTVLANYLFTWEGRSNLFQGTFEVTDAEMSESNKYFYFLSLSNSISIFSPDGRDFRWSANPPMGPDYFGVGGGSLLSTFGIGLDYPQTTAQGNILEVDANNDSVQEWSWPPLGVGGSASLLYSETGQWEVSNVSEPSAAALLALGTAVWLIRRHRTHQTSDQT